MCVLKYTVIEIASRPSFVGKKVSGFHFKIYKIFFKTKKKIKNMQNIKKHKVVHIKIAKHLKENNVNKQNAKIHIKNGNKIL